MLWQNIPATTLLKDYGSWILPHLVQNNRVIDLLGLAEDPYQPVRDAGAWILRGTDDRILQIVAQTPRALSLVHHPDFQLDDAQVAAIQQRFPGSWVITCHGEQCNRWETAARLLGIRDVPLLSTWLYQLHPQRLRQKPLPADLRFEALPQFNRQIARHIQGFMLEALQQRVDENEARQRFARHKFFGLLQGDQLLSIAAITRNIFHGRCLSYVHTAPRFRGRDCAGLTVEHLCRHIFQNPAMQLVFLYADQESAGSNRLYQKLGFEMVCAARIF